MVDIEYSGVTQVMSGGSCVLFRAKLRIRGGDRSRLSLRERVAMDWLGGGAGDPGEGSNWQVWS